MCPAPGINKERLPANHGSLLIEKLAANMFNVTVFQVFNKRIGGMLWIQAAPFVFSIYFLDVS